MVLIPAYCTRCDLAFQTGGLDIEAKNVSIHDNVAYCPKCKQAASFLEGDFSVDSDGKIDMKSGMPPLTREMLERFDLLTREAKRSDMDLPNYALEAAKIHPALGHVVNELAKKTIEATKGTIKSVNKNKVKYGVFAAVLTALSTCEWDGNKLLDQTGVAEVIKHQVTKLIPSENKPEEKNSDVGKNAASDKPSVKNP